MACTKIKHARCLIFGGLRGRVPRRAGLKKGRKPFFNILLVLAVDAPTGDSLSKHSKSDILRLAIPLFAQAGFNGVSMRHVADTVGVSPAALYHHFKDKEELYLETMRYAFADKIASFKAMLQAPADALALLETLIRWLAETLHAETDFRKLLQWVLLDADSNRTVRLVKSTFEELFTILQNLNQGFRQRFDPHLLSISLIGLVVYHFETTAVRKILPGHRAEHDQPETLVRHLMQLLRPALHS